MVSIDQQDHGGTASIVAIYSILLHFARAMTAIRLVATAGVAKMNCESWLLCSLSHVCECPYCKQTPCELYKEEE